MSRYDLNNDKRHIVASHQDEIEQQGQEKDLPPTDTKSLAGPKPMHFFDLPLEIRQTTYAYLFQDVDVIYYNLSILPGKDSVIARHKHDSAVFRVCKQLYQESFHVYLSHACFVVYDYAGAFVDLRQKQERLLQNIARLEIWSYETNPVYDNCYPWLTLFPKLRELTVVSTPISWLQAWDNWAELEESRKDAKIQMLSEVRSDRLPMIEYCAREGIDLARYISEAQLATAVFVRVKVKGSLIQQEDREEYHYYVQGLARVTAWLMALAVLNLAVNESKCGLLSRLEGTIILLAVSRIKPSRMPMGGARCLRPSKIMGHITYPNLKAMATEVGGEREMDRVVPLPLVDCDIAKMLKDI